MCGFSPNRRKWKRRQREKRSRNNWRIFFLLTWVRSRGRSPRNQGGGEGPGRFQGQSLREPRPEFQRPEPQRQDYDLPPFLLRRVGPRGDLQQKEEDSTPGGMRELHAAGTPLPWGGRQAQNSAQATRQAPRVSACLLSCRWRNAPSGFWYGFLAFPIQATGGIIS